MKWTSYICSMLPVCRATYVMILNAGPLRKLICVSVLCLTLIITLPPLRNHKRGSWDDTIAPVEMAAFLLRAPNQLCYCVCFFPALFVTYFIRNVSATISYDRKELLDIRAEMTHLVLYEDLLKKNIYIYESDAKDLLHSDEEEREISRT
jgi:hypothetical protein